MGAVQFFFRYHIIFKVKVRRDWLASVCSEKCDCGWGGLSSVKRGGGALERAGRDK